ncbi:serine/threonine-protein kinase [Paenarthrobacter sp. NPDC092416]|uniref:serine/threonine-protein kinase n=1 Tax=Paenarthrobacter sp. NPDC092416 TaxID=3364386 RepID=UPI003827D5A8
MDKPENLVAAAPVIPGYSVSRLLGTGASSSVWLTSRDKDGLLFAVKCLTGTTSPAEAEPGAPYEPGSPSACQAGGLGRAELMREVRILSGLKHEHLVRVHDVVQLDGAATGSVGLVMDYAAGGSLGNLVGARGALGVGEALTVLTPIAQTLAYLHANGLVHADVSPGNVLFTALGKPLLADLGLAKLVGETPAGFDAGTPGFVDTVDRSSMGVGDLTLRPERDVYALAALGWYCLTGTTPAPAPRRPPLSLLVAEVPPGLAAALEAGLNPDPAARPSAKELGTAIYRSAAPEPVDLSGAVHRSVLPELLTRREAGGRVRRRGASRGLSLFRTAIRSASPKRTTVFVGAAVVVGVLGWTSWHAIQTSSEAVSQVKSGRALLREQDRIPEELAVRLQSEDPEVAVKALSELRDIALASHRPRLLTRVNAPDSPAQAADAHLMQQLQKDEVRLQGLVTTLSDVATEATTEAATSEGAATEDERAVVAVTATTSGFEEVSRSGTVLGTRGAGQAQELRLVVLRSDGGWRISEILGPGT